MWTASVLPLLILWELYGFFLLIADSEMQKLVTFAEENAKPLKEKLQHAKLIQDQIKLQELSPGYLSSDQTKNLRTETEEKIRKAKEIISSLEKLLKDPDFLEQEEVKKLGQAVKKLKGQI